MEITGTYVLNVPQQQVWESMMEPDVLTQCIPACQQIHKTTEDEFFARVKVKFGFIPVKFDVKVGLSNILQPCSYSLDARAQGGLANAAKAIGDVEFIKLDPSTTEVNFLGKILPGSKLFELGEPIVQKTASKWFNLFLNGLKK